MKQLLLIEDDVNLNNGVTLQLKKAGYDVLSAYNLQEARYLFAKHEIDLVISDINLPDGNGVVFCQEIRQTSSVYLIFLTALDQEIDIVTGYDIGADDYLTKPFSLQVLLSKVNALLRRLNKESSQYLYSGNVRVGINEMKVYLNDELVNFSKTELQLLIYLMKNAKQIVSKEQILSQVWDLEGSFIDENTVTVNVSRIKSKIGTDTIKNVRGLGYIWVADVSQ